VESLATAKSIQPFVIYIHEHGSQSVVAVGVRHASLHAYVSKGAIAIVVKQMIVFARHVFTDNLADNDPSIPVCNRKGDILADFFRKALNGYDYDNGE
jgi:hypothetical protein